MPADTPAAVIRWFVLRRAVRSGAVWGLVFAAVVSSSALGYVATYADDATGRATLARSLGGNVGIAALFGPTRRIDTVAGFTAWRSGVLLALVGGVWAVLFSTRLLRGEEDAGRWEMLLAGATTRRKAAADALSAFGVGLLALWAVTAASVVAVGRADEVGFSLRESLFFATALAAGPAMFMALGALCSQLAPTRRAAAALAAAVLGGAFVVRMVADTTPSLRWMEWVSPLGWVTHLHAMTGSAPGALIPIGGLTLGAAAVTVVLAGVRDCGGSALPDRDSAEPRLALLGGPIGLAVRLGRAVAIAWWAGIAAMSAIIGLVAKSAGEAIADSQGFTSLMDRLGVTAVGARAYLGLAFLIIATLTALQAAGAAVATRNEEGTGLADNTLVRSVTRAKFMASRLAPAVVALVIGGAVAGVLTWVAAATQDTGVGFGDLLLAGVHIVPVGLVVLGVGTMAHGFAPRRVATATYGLIAWSFLLEFVGASVNADPRLLDLSLFHHVSGAPAESPDWRTSAVLVAIAAATAAAGVWRFTTRDIAGE